ncbi:serine protease HTRA2, mitochondrial [Cylas formicarius]|uniref:serine protease HTRA2, mitochondrial n=1 Tax=Cylas formicarius TaxID=197179 RepID=UPI0029588D0B|nr:serine protease HTRA2, mitochondrial [Cylas formicarius]
MKIFKMLLVGRRALSGRRNYPGGNKEILKKVNLYGTFGIAAALLASYVVVRNAYRGKTEPIQNFDYVLPSNGPASNQAVLEEHVRQNEEETKEEGFRDKYNFIKKVVNECAGAVFYLELRDPHQKDPETGDPQITSNGSGFVISEDGWALTNAHVVLSKPQSTITAIMGDGKTYRARVEDADLNVDLALLKLDVREKLPCLQLGQIGDACVGEWVVALGSPLSLNNSVTVGIISSVNRPAEELGLRNYSMTYIQTDASITFGNSGGPLVNLDGNVVGINNLRLTSGISFAIPVEYAKKFLENSKYRMSKLSSGTNRGKTLFGLTTISITAELLEELGKTNDQVPKNVSEGLLVWKIIPGTPADASGIEVGDIITHVNGVPVKSAAELYVASEENALEIRLINKGKKKKVLLSTKSSSLI